MKIDCSDFNLAATLESGQVFGFEKDAKGAYSGVIAGHPVRLSQRTQSHGEALEVSFTGLMPPHGAASGRVREFFDLGRDMTPIFSIIEGEPALAPALSSFRGLRIISQDPWEALACFILSSNNNVKRIMGIHRNMVAHFGGFPTSLQVAKSHERILRGLGLGYRAPFLLHTAQFLSVNPFYLESVRHADYDEAYSRVLAFPGIGPKVADCVLLYGFHRLDAFPVDVWILRAVRKLFFRNRSVSEARVHAFGRKRWGALSGYVQQYLFHGARTGVLY